jgi:hypothetical protein
MLPYKTHSGTSETCGRCGREVVEGKAILFPTDAPGRFAYRCLVCFDNTSTCDFCDGELHLCLSPVCLRTNAAELQRNSY